LLGLGRGARAAAKVDIQDMYAVVVKDNETFDPRREVYEAAPFSGAMANLISQP
jgi:hypothetical protein